MFTTPTRIGSGIKCPGAPRKAVSFMPFNSKLAESSDSLIHDHLFPRMIRAELSVLRTPGKEPSTPTRIGSAIKCPGAPRKAVSFVPFTCNLAEPSDDSICDELFPRIVRAETVKKPATPTRIGSGLECPGAPRKAVSFMPFHDEPTESSDSPILGHAFLMRLHAELAGPNTPVKKSSKVVKTPGAPRKAIGSRPVERSFEEIASSSLCDSPCPRRGSLTFPNF